MKIDRIEMKSMTTLMISDRQFTLDQRPDYLDVKLLIAKIVVEH